MSDGVQVALITAGFASFTTLAALILTHILGARDRTLASNAVTAKNAEIEAIKVKYNSDTTTLKEDLATCQQTLSTFTEINP